MRKSLLGIALIGAFLLNTSSASALSCLPIDMYLNSVVGDETTQIFVGTASPEKNHTQVVTVTKPLQGWIMNTVFVQHPWSNDWHYFCSNGPPTPGAQTIFLATLDEYGSYSVTQTLPVDSEYAQDLIEALEDGGAKAGVTEETPEERAQSVRQSIIELIRVLITMLTELSYWESKS